jgi:hypothetical protein
MKPTKRKAFNFLRSYFDVLNELNNDKDKLDFLISIINKQFLDEDPKGLNFIVNLCYESQRHAIESSVKGWKRVNNIDPTTNPMTNPTTNPATNPKEEEEEEEEKEKEKEKNIVFSFENFWSKYPSKVAKQKCKEKYSKLKDAELKAIKDTIYAFVKYKPFEGYTHPNPLTYLNQKRWEDEIPETEKPRQQETMEETILRIKKERGWIS